WSASGWAVGRLWRLGVLAVPAVGWLAVGLLAPHPRDVLMKGVGGLGPGRARAVGHLASGRLGIARRLGLEHTGRLLHRRVVRALAGQSPHLFIALSACPGTYDESDPQAGKEHDAVPHLAPLLHCVRRMDLRS